jgi:hypothetical protein
MHVPEGDRPAEGGEGRGRHRGPRIALCGSSDLEFYPDWLVDFLSELPADTVILLRRGNQRDPGLFETVMAKLALTHLWLDVRWMRPDPEQGRSAVFLRDVEMVKEADLVLAFLSSDTMTGGTGHVVEKAMELDIPVYAYGLSSGQFVRIGEYDPHEAWTVPS